MKSSKTLNPLVGLRASLLDCALGYRIRSNQAIYAGIKPEIERAGGNVWVARVLDCFIVCLATAFCANASMISGMRIEIKQTDAVILLACALDCLIVCPVTAFCSNQAIKFRN